MNDKRKEVYNRYAELLKAGWTVTQVNEATEVHMKWWEEQLNKQNEPSESEKIIEKYQRRLDERFNGAKDWNTHLDESCEQFKKDMDKKCDQFIKEFKVPFWKTLILSTLVAVVAVVLTRIVILSVKGN